MKNILRSLREITQYPSALFGLVIILKLVVVADLCSGHDPLQRSDAFMARRRRCLVYEPPHRSTRLCELVYTPQKLPPTIRVDSRETPEIKQFEQISEDTGEVLFNLTFDYDYDAYPQEIIIFFRSQYQAKQPHVSAEWITPDGREIRLGSFSVGRSQSFRFNQDSRLQRRLNNLPPEKILLSVPDLTVL
jgi:hypothetical protein